MDSVNALDVMEGGFDFRLRTRLLYGVGSIDRAGEIVRELLADSKVVRPRVLLVTDVHLVAAGHVARAQAALAESGLDVHVFDGVRENPTTVDVEACLEVARELGPELLLGLGGGSSVDVAKGTNLLFAGGGKMQDYWGIGKARGRLLPLVALPTTAGTGTEAQSFALIADDDTHQKMACGDPQVAPRAAILDPAVTVTQPRVVTAQTGLDAIGHAVETAVTRSRSEVSGVFSRESFRLANRCFPRVLLDPEDLDARGGMLLAAAYAGIAIENSMLGGAHSMANPLTAHFGVAHGQAVGMALPHIVRFNAADPDGACEHLYARLAQAAGLEASSQALGRRLEELLSLAGMPSSLSACGIPTTAAADLAQEAARQWTAGFNPRALDADSLRSLFEEALA